MLSTATSPEKTTQSHHESTFTDSVKNAIRGYFAQLDGEQPNELYKLVLAEIEPPLFKTIINITQGNQSKAAKILGMSRGTLRKKLAEYDINT